MFGNNNIIENSEHLRVRSRDDGKDNPDQDQ